MRIQNIVRNPCPICGNETTLAVIEPHPTHPGTELHTYQCVDCGPVKTTSSTAFGWIDESGIASDSADGEELASRSFTELRGRLLRKR